MGNMEKYSAEKPHFDDLVANLGKICTSLGNPLVLSQSKDATQKLYDALMVEAEEFAARYRAIGEMTERGGEIAKRFAVVAGEFFLRGISVGVKMSPENHVRALQQYNKRGACTDPVDVYALTWIFDV